MKKLFLYAAMGLTVLSSLTWLTACGDDDDENANVWEQYADNRQANQQWLDQEENRLNPDGTKFYERLTPPWNPGEYILIHWFNNRAETAGNLRPLLTSSVRVWYVGRNSSYQVFDADSTSTDGTFFKVNGVVSGWQTALQNMHVGDTVQVLLPYSQAYGSSQPNSLIPPYSALQFNIRLLDVPTYEVRP